MAEEPGWFWRDCAACRKWLLDEQGRIRRDRQGRPIPNPAPPKCEETPCWDAELERRRPRFGAAERASFRRWQLCRSTRCLPLPGALADQNPWDMERFRILESQENAAEQKRQWEFLAAVVGVRLAR